MQPDFLLSLVVAVYYEEECIQHFIKAVQTELDRLGYKYEIIFIDDGSTDRTVELIKEAASTDNCIKLIEFSYNHGKEAAVTAGIQHASGDYILMMDPDLQDPPAEIGRFVDEIQEGYDLVFGIRKDRQDSLITKIFSSVFWWTLDKFTALDIPRPLAVMRIFNRRFADKFCEYSEANRFIEGLFMNVGMKRTQIEIEHHERFAGKSKYNFKRKMQLALKAIFDYSDLPLKIATRFGAILIGLSFLTLAALVFLRLFVMDFQLGWPSVFCMLLFGFGLQLFFFGLIGKYVGNIYREVKARPLYSISETTNIGHEAACLESKSVANLP